MSQITDFLINEGGIQEEIVVLLLFIPIISTIIGFSRYYIGIKTFSLYVPLLLSVAFYLIKINHEGNQNDQIITGLLWGTIFTLIVLISTGAIVKLFSRTHMHYFPRISLAISSVVVVLITSLVMFIYFDLISVNEVNVTSIVLILLTSERFVSTLSKKRIITTIKLSIETILISVVCYLVMVFIPLQELLLNNPVIILITIPLSYIIGRYTGLRATEFIRFQDILQEETEE